MKGTRLLFIGLFGLLVLTFVLSYYVLGKQVKTLDSKNNVVDESQCKGDNKYYSHYGTMGKAICVTRYIDAGKDCNDGKDCLSGKCVMSFDEASKVIESKFGKNAKKISQEDVESIILVEGSGKCKKDNIPDCYSDIQGGVIVNNNKMVDRVPFCD